MRYRKPTSKPVNKKIGVVTLCVIVLIAIVFGIWCVQWTQMENSKGGYVDMTEINKKDPTQEIETKFMEDMNPAYRYRCQFSFGGDCGRHCDLYAGYGADDSGAGELSDSYVEELSDT